VDKWGPPAALNIRGDFIKPSQLLGAAVAVGTGSDGSGGPIITAGRACRVRATARSTGDLLLLIFFIFYF